MIGLQIVLELALLSNLWLCGNYFVSRHSSFFHQRMKPTLSTLKKGKKLSGSRNSHVKKCIRSCFINHFFIKIVLSKLLIPFLDKKKICYKNHVH